MSGNTGRHSALTCAKMAEPMEMPFGFWVVDSGAPKEACIRWGCTVAQPGEYDWTVHVRRRCDRFIKLHWPLVFYL